MCVILDNSGFLFRYLNSYIQTFLEEFSDNKQKTCIRYENDGIKSTEMIFRLYGCFRFTREKKPK